MRFARQSPRAGASVTYASTGCSAGPPEAGGLHGGGRCLSAFSKKAKQVRVKNEPDKAADRR